jgi:hypothetical protein
MSWGVNYTPDDLVRDEGVLFCFYRLWLLSNPFSRLETAAWLVRSGPFYTLNIWPVSAPAALTEANIAGAASSDGKPPPETAAIVHTHPYQDLDGGSVKRGPSFHDLAAACNTPDRETGGQGMDVYGVTAEELWKVDRFGNTVWLAGQGWYKPVERAVRAYLKK